MTRILAAGMLLLTGLAVVTGFGRTFDFADGKWDRGAFFEARNDDWNRGDPIVQMPDCVMNANDPKWTDEDLFKNHQADVYSSLILTNRFRGDVTFSSKMSFDHRMAPSLVIAGEFATDAEGRKAFRDIYEIVLFEAGHRDNYPAAVDFLARQRRGSAPDWTLPETAAGGSGLNRTISR